MNTTMRDLAHDWVTQDARAHRLMVQVTNALADPSTTQTRVDTLRVDLERADRMSEDAWHRYRKALDAHLNWITAAAIVLGAVAGFVGGGLVAAVLR